MKPTDEELIKKCLKNDPVAQRELYDRHSAILFGVCIRYARNRQDAEDIFQDAFIKAFAQLDKFEFKGSFASWIRRLFVNYALNYYRYDKSHRFVDVQEYETISDKPLQLSALSTEDVLKLVALLPEECRIVFNLVEIEGYSYKELAQMWNANESSLRGMNFRAKKILKSKLESMGIK